MIDVDVDETSRRCSTVHVPDLLLARIAAPSGASQVFMSRAYGAVGDRADFGGFTGFSL